MFADGWSGLSSDCSGDYTETWGAIPGAAKGWFPFIFVYSNTITSLYPGQQCL